MFFGKKWTFPQRRVHYVQYQYFLLYILLIWGGGAYAPDAPPCLGACRQTLTTSPVSVRDRRPLQCDVTGASLQLQRLQPDAAVMLTT